MDCPACIEQLIAVEFQQIEVDVCLMGCQGMWLDAGELSYFEAHLAEDDFAVMSPRDGQPLRCCPRCDRPMQVGHLPVGGPLLDRCPAGHGLWLDAGELQTLMALPLVPEPTHPLYFLQKLLTKE